MRGGEVRWRVLPVPGGCRLEVQLVGDDIIQNVDVELTLDGAAQLAYDLDAACRVSLDRNHVAGHREAKADLDVRN